MKNVYNERMVEETASQWPNFLSLLLPGSTARHLFPGCLGVRCRSLVGSRQIICVSLSGLTPNHSHTYTSCPFHLFCFVADKHGKLWSWKLSKREPQMDSIWSNTWQNSLPNSNTYLGFTREILTCSCWYSWHLPYYLRHNHSICNCWSDTNTIVLRQGLPLWPMLA
jgi:hypothetical protein